MATFYPKHVIVADDATDLANLKAYLDGIGYTSGTTSLGVRADDDGSLTVTIDYPSYTFTP